MRRLFFFVAFSAMATLVAVGSAGAQTPTDAVGPGQIFNGFVNGSVKHATVMMACAGAVRPGQLGHPAAGQTVGAARSVDLQPNGFTGRADSISVDFKLRFPIPHTIHVATFSRYGTKNIPTKIELPCAGSGRAVFSPVNGGGSGRQQTVDFTLVGLP